MPPGSKDVSTTRTMCWLYHSMPTSTTVKLSPAFVWSLKKMSFAWISTEKSSPAMPPEMPLPCGEKRVRLTQKMAQDGPCVAVGVQPSRAEAGPTSGQAWRLPHLGDAGRRVGLRGLDDGHVRRALDVLALAKRVHAEGAGHRDVIRHRVRRVLVSQGSAAASSQQQRCRLS